MPRSSRPGSGPSTPTSRRSPSPGTSAGPTCWISGSAGSSTADIPLYGGLDTVKLDADVVGRAEALGAELWAADWCRYSTGGSTHANQAVALAVGQPGDRVLVARNAHRSTLTGLVLAGLEPVWLPSVIDENLGVPTGLDLDAVRRAFEDEPAAKALFCVEPGYLGTVSDLPGAHRAGATTTGSRSSSTRRGGRTSDATRTTRSRRSRSAPTPWS